VTTLKCASECSVCAQMSSEDKIVKLNLCDYFFLSDVVVHEFTTSRNGRMIRTTLLLILCFTFVTYTLAIDEVLQKSKYTEDRSLAYEDVMLYAMICK